MTDWNNLFKVKIANATPSFLKHEIVKTILVCKLLHKYRRRKNYIKIYTEFWIDNKKKADVYFEDAKNKSILIFEIQKDYSPKWIKMNADFYNNYEVYGFNSIDWIPINLNELSDDINKLNEQLDKYI